MSFSFSASLQPQRPRQRFGARRSRPGVTLLEIILAIAILGASLAALSTVVMTGADAAAEARDLAVAQMLCQQQLAQVLLNTNVSPIPFSDAAIEPPDPSMVAAATLDVQPAPLNGMLWLRMTVTIAAADGSSRPTEFSLSRWMIDPALGLEQLEAQEKAAAEEAAAEANSSAGAATSGTTAPAGGAP